MEIEKEKLDGEKAAFEEDVKKAKQNLKETRAQNELLHKQMEALSSQLEKKQADRVEAAADGKETTTEEITALNKTVSELREVIRFMRLQNDIEQSQLDAARRTAKREKAAAAVAKQSLEEALAELKVVQELTPEASQEAKFEHEKLTKAEDQLTLL
uniref:Uncharacterized protein n=1 Tax=Cyclophora tenuis TaxID=216820 RepID=A0A6U1SP83_CYCTE|mmetsp:Transcript_8682/g.14669  ORF Transcript_8682/g.14669 Transcript_8682/m.14669 type:complete len:157 (+) Transcript_8682:582-1052(+)